MQFARECVRENRPVCRPQLVFQPQLRFNRADLIMRGDHFASNLPRNVLSRRFGNREARATFGQPAKPNTYIGATRDRVFPASRRSLSRQISLAIARQEIAHRYRAMAVDYSAQKPFCDWKFELGDFAFAIWKKRVDARLFFFVIWISDDEYFGEIRCKRDRYGRFFDRMKHYCFQHVDCMSMVTGEKWSI